MALLAVRSQWRFGIEEDLPQQGMSNSALNFNLSDFQYNG
jgi:hypothetical protein